MLTLPIKKKIAMKKKFIRVCLDGCAIIAFSLSLFLAFTNFPNNENTTFDYQAILIGILAAIFTLLVGWNIFNVIDFKKKENKIDELEQSLKAQTAKNKYSMDSSYALIMSYVSMLLYSQLVQSSRDKILFRMIWGSLATISVYCHLGDIVAGEKELNTLLKRLDKIKFINLDVDQKTQLLVKIGSIEKHDKLLRINELIKRLQ